MACLTGCDVILQFYAFIQMESRRLLLRQLAGPVAWHVLEVLLEHTEPVTQAELAATLGRSQSAISRALAALERAGLASSASTPTKRRGAGRPPRRWAPDRERWTRLSEV
jgi:predicted ArsR family transcriptional regulator